MRPIPFGRRRQPGHRRATLVALVVAPLALTGCGLGTDLYSTTLPGGADVGKNPILIKAAFTDVVDLVPQSSVKVENIAVGRVKSIALAEDGRSADVEILVRRDVDLPQGTTARLQQTSLLGEKYISLNRPDTAVAGAGSLSDGSVIPIDDTSQQAEVEQVLGALSLVVNGGGVAKFQEISRELQKVSTGRPEEIKAFLRSMGTFVGSLDANKKALTDALDAMATLSTTLDNDKDKIATALQDLSPGMQVLAEQRTELVSMLTALDELSKVSIRTLDASQKNMVEDMKLLEPILDQLAASGKALPNSLELLLTYPFPDSVLGAIRGDYFNVFATANFTSLPDSCTGIGCPWPQLEDTGTMPPQSLLGDQSVRLRAPSATTTSADSASTGPSAGHSGAGELTVTTSSAASSTAPGTGSASPSTSGSPTPQPSGRGSATTSGTATPSPTLLPPTDSALTGIPERSIQVPSASASHPASNPASNPAQED